MVRQKKQQARAGAWSEDWFLKESAALPGSRASGAKEKQMNPWSALLNEGMLAQGKGIGNGGEHS
jgi:hypothetical protein